MIFDELYTVKQNEGTVVIFTVENGEVTYNLFYEYLDYSERPVMTNNEAIANELDSCGIDIEILKILAYHKACNLDGSVIYFTFLEA